jgi:hypothetical protein
MIVWQYNWNNVAKVSFAHNPSGASPAPRSGSLPPTPLPGAQHLDLRELKKRCLTPRLMLRHNQSRRGNAWKSL